MLHLSQRDIQKHHQRKTKRGANGADVSVRILLRFGNQFLHHNVNHGSGSKGQDVG